jgi:hypothetical protein
MRRTLYKTNYLVGLNKPPHPARLIIYGYKINCA